MKLFNPFKPHVVRFNNGNFGVRKWSWICGWEFYDQHSGSHWWHMMEHVTKYAQALSTLNLRMPLDKGVYFG